MSLLMGTISELHGSFMHVSNIARDSARYLYGMDCCSMRSSRKISDECPGFDFDSLEKIERLIFEKLPSFCRRDLPPSGLNLVAKCNTSKCALNYGGCVIIEKGIGKFDLIRELFQKHICPDCQQELSEVYDIWFVDCKYAIDGKQIAPERTKVEYTGESKGSFAFAHSARKTVARWLTLEVTTVMPEWRIRKNGMNIRGHCTNENCKSNLEEDAVLVHIPGNGPHEISKLAPKCTLCKHPIAEIDSIWLRNCTFTVKERDPIDGPIYTKKQDFSFPKEHVYYFQRGLFVTLTSIDPD